VAVILPSNVRVRIGYPRWLLLPRNVAAITLGRRIWVARELPPAQMDALLRHELVHVRQMERLGVAVFLLRYVAEYVRNRVRGLGHDASYRAISFEREAFAVEAEPGTEKPGTGTGTGAGTGWGS
jgi:hypothetical protein